MLALEDRQERSGASPRIHSQAALGPGRRRGLKVTGEPWFPCSYHGGGNGGTPGSPVRISSSDARRIALFADAVFLARDELENVRLVAPEEQRRHEDQRGQDFSRAEQEEIVERCKYGGDDGRERRIPKEERDNDPGRNRRETQPRIDGKQDPARRRYALAALEAEEHRKDMTQEHRDRAGRDSHRVHIVFGGVTQCEEH